MWVAWRWKRIETRTHPQFAKLVGEEIGIHSGKYWDPTAIEMARPYLSKAQIRKTLEWRDRFPRGALVATGQVKEHRRLQPHDAKAALIECETTRFGLVLTEVGAIEPIAMRGWQGIWYRALDDIRGLARKG